MIIKSSLKNYEVNIHEDLVDIENVISFDFASTLYVIDANVYKLYKNYFEFIPHQNLITIDAIEENKKIDTSLSICEKLVELGAKRNATLVSVGGGIIQDISGFSANIIYRGINWVFLPTTILSGCDSCIGGKTSLNYNKYKNLLGTFYAPNSIHIFTPFFKTLSQRDYYSGLGEVVKFNIMRGGNGLTQVEEKLELLLNNDYETMKFFLENSLDFKKTFIEIDEFDRGERIKLNFAHTFGHAIESTTNYKVPHGTAVAMGMIVANKISEMRGNLSKDFVDRATKVLNKIILFDHIDVTTEDIVLAIRKDKKQISKDSLTCVLLVNDGQELKIVNDLKVEEIEKAYAYLSDELKLEKV